MKKQNEILNEILTALYKEIELEVIKIAIKETNIFVRIKRDTTKSAEELEGVQKVLNEYINESVKYYRINDNPQYIYFNVGLF